MATPTETAPKAGSLALPSEMIRKIRIIAAHRGISMSEVVLPFIVDKIDREYSKVIRDLEDCGEAGA